MNEIAVSDIATFLALLEKIALDTDWQILPVDPKHPLIRLTRNGRKWVFCPLSAVYFDLTGQEIHSCFTMPEITATTSMPPSLVLEIAYAADACSCGRAFDAHLREKILTSLGQLKQETQRGQNET